jgi:hypothetical protein
MRVNVEADIDLIDILEECEISDLLSALKSRQLKGREEWTAKDVAQSLDALSELTLSNVAYYLSDEAAKILFEAIKFYRKDLA